MPRKTTHALTRAAGGALLDAWRFAGQRNTPLNGLLTVHMAKLDGGGDTLARQARWRERMAKWLAARRVPVAWIWWREHGRLAGEHYHMLLHLPARHRPAFARMVRAAWVQDGEPGAIDGPKAASGDDAMIGYALKDLVRDDWRSLNLSASLWSYYSGGRSLKPILGKRCGTSESIGRTAQAHYYAALGITIPGAPNPAKPRRRPARPLPSRYGGPRRPKEAA